MQLKKKIEDRYSVVADGDVIDMKPQLKKKKQADLQPKFDQAKMRIKKSSAYAGGYELVVNVPVPADFLKKGKDNPMGEFVRQLHDFVGKHMDKWMGTPMIGQDKRAKDGIINVTATWHFDDAFLAYGLGLNLDEYSGSNEVVEKSKIEPRIKEAQQALVELDGFKKKAREEIKTLPEEAQDTAWKTDYMPDFVKLNDKWKKKGISYMALKDKR